MDNVKFLIVDDHQIIVDGLKKIVLEIDNWEVIATAGDGAESLQKVDVFQPDIVLMDIDMPTKNGIEASKELLKSYPHLKVVILSMHANRSMVEKLMQIGVSGYFLKNTDKEELQMGLRHILRGKKYFQAEAIEGFVKSSHMDSSKENMEQLSILSPREIEILKEIARGKSTKAIASQLHLSPRTVETHRKNLHYKLEVNNISGLVRFAIKSGLID